MASSEHKNVEGLGPGVVGNSGSGSVGDEEGVAARKSETLPEEKLQSVNFGIEESRHRRGMQVSMFSTAITFCALLFLAAVVLGVVLVANIVVKPEIHWHASILVAAFVVPPTVIMLSLVRSVMGADGKDKDKEKDKDVAGTSVPVLEILRETAKALKELGKFKSNA